MNDPFQPPDHSLSRKVYWACDFDEALAARHNALWLEAYRLEKLSAALCKRLARKPAADEPERPRPDRP